MAQDAEIAEILADWRERCDRGEDVSLDDLAGEHPELATSLREHVAALEAAEAVLGLDADVEPLRPTGSDTRGNAMRLRAMAPERYVDFRSIGEGGMGIVYWALDTELNRQVALKIVRPGGPADTGTPAAPLDVSPPGKDTPATTAFETLKSRFLQEAWVTGGLEHPGIVPVYELGETPEGVPYYTMRFIRGERTLATAIEEVAEKGTEERLKLLEPFLKVCDTMRYAHARGVVHRDIKPENIALGQFGEVVVIDWGLAKLHEEEHLAESRWRERALKFRDAEDFHTIAGVLGTPGYMSPEAAVGDPGSVDELSDVYSLGAILYQILTGSRPFQFATYEAFLRQVLRSDPPSAKSCEESVPEALSTLCSQALARDRLQRPESVDQLANGIREWQAQSAAQREIEGWLRSVDAALESALELSGEERLRQLDRAGGPLSEIFARDPKNEAATARQTRLDGLREHGVREREKAVRRRVVRRVALAALVVATAAGFLVSRALRAERDEATEHLWASHLARARSVQRTNLPGRRFEALDALRKAAAIRPSLELRNEALAAMALTDIRRLEGVPGGVAFEPGFGLHTVPDGEGGLRLMSAVDGQELLHVRDLGREYGYLPSVSPGGRFVAMAFGASPGGEGWARPRRIWEIASGQLIHETLPVTDGALAFSPDGRILATGHHGGRINLFDLESRSVVLSRLTGVVAVDLGFSPDGSRLALSSRAQGRLLVLDAKSGDVLADHAHEGGLRGLCWSPDGRHVAVAHAPHEVYVWPASPAKEPSAILRIARGTPTRCAFHCDGDHLFAGGWGLGLLVWEWGSGRLSLVDDGGRGSLFQLSSSGRFGWWPQFGRLGDVTRDTLWGIVDAGWFEVAAGDVCRRISCPCHALDLHPSDRVLALSRPDGVMLLDATTGHELRLIPLGRIEYAGFDRMGRYLVSSGDRGVTRCEVRFETRDGQSHLVVGPAQRVRRIVGATDNAAWSLDRSTFAAVGALHQTVHVFRNFEQAPIEIEVGVPARQVGVCLNPDGSLLATGYWRGTGGVRVWDTRTGALVRELPPSAGTGSTWFTPDGRWLLTASSARTGGVRWSVGTWESEPWDYEEYVVSPSNDNFRAVRLENSIRLVDQESGSILGELQLRDRLNLTPRFSHDGALLYGITSGTFVRWDLDLMGKELEALSLAWERPATSGRETHVPLVPERVHVRLGPDFEEKRDPGTTLTELDQAIATDPRHAEAYRRRALLHAAAERFAEALEDLNRTIGLQSDVAEGYAQRAAVYVSLGDSDAALRDLDRALALGSDWRHYRSRGRLRLERGDVEDAVEDLTAAYKISYSGSAARDVAWLWANGPEAVRNPQSAYFASQRAASGAPEDPEVLRLLGIAAYRYERYREALTQLRRANELTDTTDADGRALGLLFEAMAQARLEQRQEAKAAYEEALTWIKNEPHPSPQKRDELESARAEAEALLVDCSRR